MGNKWTVYKHTNKANGKVYIGITSQRVELRWQNGYGYSGHNYFYRAIKKYGWSGFEHIVVADGLTKEESCNMEIKLIKEYNSTDNNFGYNSRYGGESNIPNEETCKKISKNHANVNGELNPFHGKSHSDESKAKNSRSHKGKVASIETRSKMSEMRSGEKHHFYGKTFSFEYRKKISEGMKGKILSKEHRDKLSASWTKERREKWIEIMKRKIGENNPKIKPVICVTTGKIFNGLKIAGDYYGLRSSHISSCCSGKLKSAGKHPETKEKMVWRYL